MSAPACSAMAWASFTSGVANGRVRAAPSAATPALRVRTGATTKLSWRADGDIAGVLSILAFTFTMVTGGNDTTTGMLGGAVQLLQQRPDQRKLLVDDPELILESIDEFLRLTSPVQGLARTTTRDVTIGDTTIPAGRKKLTGYVPPAICKRYCGCGGLGVPCIEDGTGVPK